MAHYGFYAAILRFVARKTDRTDQRIAAMMRELEQTADQITATGSYKVEPQRFDIHAKALGGVAAFLQAHILPETIADNNKAAETQIRWSVDTALETLNQLVRAQEADSPDAMTIMLPPPPLP
jgi:hypothetical protein